MTSVPPNMPVPVYPPFLEPVGVPSGAQPVTGFGVFRVGEYVGGIGRVGGLVPVETLGLGSEPTTEQPSNGQAVGVFNSDFQKDGGMIHATK